MIFKKTIAILVFVTTCLCGEIEKRIYKEIKDYQQCILLTNATHQIGCTSDMKGNRGVLHFVDNENDLNWLINEGKHDPYIPLLNSSMFTRPVLDRLTASKKVTGILMVHLASTELPSRGFSPDNTCPMDNFGSYANHKDYGSCKKVVWNPVGDGMAFVYYGIPIFSLTNAKEIDSLVECYRKHNQPKQGDEIEYPLCAVEIKNFMFAAKDTPTCMRKTGTSNPIGSTYCDPLEDNNVHAFLQPLVGEVQNDEIIMATTKMDTTAFFHEIALSADNGVTGIVTLLAAGYALGEYKRSLIANNKTEDLKPILFSFFNGEAFDYIGSSKTVYNMLKRDFPYASNEPNPKFNKSKKVIDDDHLSHFGIDSIAYFLEVGQVGIGKDVYLHTDPISQEDKNVKKKVSGLLDIIQRESSKVDLPSHIVNNDQPLPPASFQRFLRKRKDIPGVVFTDHETNFTNMYYNSRFDNTLNLDILMQQYQTSDKSKPYMQINGTLIDKINKLSISLANTLYKLASNGKQPTDNITVPKNLTANLLYCFLYSANCPSYNEIFNEKETKPFPTGPISRYISVGQIDNLITKVIRRLIAYYTGEWTEGVCKKKQDKLPLAYSYMTVRGTFVNKTYTCVRSVSFYERAVSPAFGLEDYSSTEYSTWAESMWSAEVGVRMYLIAEPKYEIIILVAGVIIMLSSFILVYLIKKNANILFTPSIGIINS